MSSQITRSNIIAANQMNSNQFLSSVNPTVMQKPVGVIRQWNLVPTLANVYQNPNLMFMRGGYSGENPQAVQRNMNFHNALNTLGM